MPWRHGRPFHVEDVWNQPVWRQVLLPLTTAYITCYFLLCLFGD